MSQEEIISANTLIESGLSHDVANNAIVIIKEAAENISVPVIYLLTQVKESQNQLETSFEFFGPIGAVSGVILANKI